MRLALVRQRYSAYGGAERFIERALGALGGQGVAVTVLAREWIGAPGGLVRCDPFYVGRLWRDWSFARAVCREIARRPFDLVQSHERIDCCDIYRAGDGVPWGSRSIPITAMSSPRNGACSRARGCVR